LINHAKVTGKDGEAAMKIELIICTLAMALSAIYESQAQSPAGPSIPVNVDNLNCIPIVKDWNYMVRLYRPRKEILEGTWKFPEAQPQ
jgi:hypothetical protein